MLVEVPGRQTGTENVSYVGEAFKQFPLNSRFVSRRSFRKVIVIRIVCLLGNDLATFGTKQRNDPRLRCRPMHDGCSLLPRSSERSKILTEKQTACHAVPLLSPASGFVKVVIALESSSCAIVFAWNSDASPDDVYIPVDLRSADY